jgi:hypothetical protein
MRGRGSISGGLEWEEDLPSLGRSVGAWRERFIDAVAELMDYFAGVIEDWAKEWAPWTDRTANARQGLTARSFRRASQFVIVLAHAMWYGIYLETMAGGKWGTITPTLEQTFPRVMAAVRALAA